MPERSGKPSDLGAMAALASWPKSSEGPEWDSDEGKSPVAVELGRLEREEGREGQDGETAGALPNPA